MPNAKKLPSGNYRVQLRLNGERFSFTAPTKKEAEYKALEFSLEKSKIGTSDMTLKQACEEYIEMNSNIFSPITITNYRHTLNKHFLSIQDKKLKVITKKQVQQEVNNMVQTLKPSSIKTILMFFKTATKDYTDIFNDLKIPPIESKEIVIPTNEEIQKLLSNTQGDLQIVIALGAFAGLRIGEIRALKWEDINFSNKTISITKTLLDVKGGTIIKKPKSVAGIRIVPIPKPLEEILSKYRKESGTIIKIKSACNMLKDKCAALGMEIYHPHSLRHYYASTMLSLNIPDKYAMELMGHATNGTLKNVYQHLMLDKKKEVEQTLNSHFDDLFSVTQNGTR